MSEKKISQNSIKEISQNLCKKLGAKSVVYTDVSIDEKGIGYLRFDAYNESGYKTHEIFVDSEKNYKINKL